MEIGKFDGTYVYGWYVDGFIVGEVIEANEEYIAIEYWIPVEPETVCIVGEIKMPRFNVERNGKWACFSTVIDDFITPFKSRRRYDRWRKRAYGRAGFYPLECTNLMTYEEATRRIKQNIFGDLEKEK